MNGIACLLTVGGLSLAASAWTAPRQASQSDVAAPPSTCDFALTSTAPAEVLVKAVDDVAKLVKIPPPEGDPVVFTAMDLSAINLHIDTRPLRFTWSGAYTLQVM